MATAPQDKFHLVGHTLDQKFRVERVVTEGGFGILYQGTHLMLDRTIALKILKVPGDYSESARATFIDAFAREAKTIVRISHPNIVQVLDFGVSPMPTGEMSPWMALEWLHGPTLREVLVQRRGKGGQQPQEVLALLRPVLEALGYAHDEGIAHRDIKPANMMLVPTKRGNVLKLLDFGIAKAMENGEEAGTGHTATISSLNAFSLSYAAPEQIGGSRTGPWTDVHAMALIITELLTDLPPYDGKERTEVCVDALSSRRPTPSKRNVEAGPWEAVLNRALSLRPADRFGNANELLEALETTMAAAQVARTTVPVGLAPSQMHGAAMMPGSMPMQSAPMHQTAGFAGTMPASMSAPPGEHSFNPSTLQGMTSGTARSSGSRTLMLGVLVMIGVVALGAAVGLQFRARNAPAPATTTATNPREATPQVAATNPVPAPVAPPTSASPTPSVSPAPVQAVVAPQPNVAPQPSVEPAPTPVVADPTQPAEPQQQAAATARDGHRVHTGTASTTTRTGSRVRHGSGTAANQNVDVD